MNRVSIVLIALLVGVQPSSGAINSSFVVEIVRQLNDVYRFETIPIFSSHSLERKENLLADLSLRLAQECPLAQMRFVDASSKELRYTINRDTLSIVITTDQMSADVLKAAASRLRGMHVSKMLLIFRNPVLLTHLKYFRNWLWEAQFTNVLVLFEDLSTSQNQIFSIDPYPTLRWTNRTSITDPSRLFMKPTKNLKQYRIEVTFTRDVPRVFVLQKNGESHMVGRHGNIIKQFAEHMNIDLVTNYQPNLDMEQILRDFHTNAMELSAHSYSMFDLDETGSSYPLESVRWCIMVPLRSEVPKSEYVIIAFDWATWLVTCISVVYIAWLMRFIDPPAKNTQKRYFLRSLAILMYSPNMAEPMSSPTIPQFVFFGLVFLLGFILSCIYSTYVTSFCTNMVFQPPIDTVEDLLKEHLRVMVIDFELEAIRQRTVYGETFLKLLYPVSYFEAIRHRNNFDGHYAYSIRQDRWQYLDKQQRGLEKPLFRLSNICFGRHFIMFPLQPDSHLQEPLDNFILLVMQAGLDLFWDEKAFRSAVDMKYSRILVEQTVVIQQLRLDYFKHIYAAWSVGIGISAVCFAIEVLWSKYNRIKKTLARAKALEE